jgi:phospholipase C
MWFEGYTSILQPFNSSTVSLLGKVNPNFRSNNPFILFIRNVADDNVVNGTIIADPDPKFDDCSKTPTAAMVQGKNIGDLLNAKNIAWGWFQGGFKPTSRIDDGKAICDSKHKNIANKNQTDYSAHHEPFQYYKSTANTRHLPPKSIIGETDQANHQYDW